jgi:hypothetical protein
MMSSTNAKRTEHYGYSCDHMKMNEISVACGTYGGQGFGEET